MDHFSNIYIMYILPNVFSIAAVLILRSHNNLPEYLQLAFYNKNIAYNPWNALYSDPKKVNRSEYYQLHIHAL
jgi:hypothetical protein